LSNNQQCTIFSSAVTFQIPTTVALLAKNVGILLRSIVAASQCTVAVCTVP